MNQFTRTGSFTNEYAIAQQAFAKEDVAMIDGGTWEPGAIRKLNPNLDWGFMNMPYASEADNAYVFIPETAISINDKSSHVKEAELFLNWLFSKETYAEILKSKGNFSAQSGIGELDPAYMEVPKWLETDRVVPFSSGLSYGMAGSFIMTVVILVVTFMFVSVTRRYEKGAYG